MRRRALVGLLLAVGCAPGEPAAPDLPDSAFVDALVDVHLADARAGRTGEPADSLRQAALVGHGLDTLAFRRALAYYAAHPDAYAPLYDEALDRLLRWEGEQGDGEPGGSGEFGGDREVGEREGP